MQLHLLHLNLKFNLIDLNQPNIKNLNIAHKSFFYKNNLIFIKSINSKSFTKKTSFKGPILFNDFNTTLVVERNWKINSKPNGSYEIIRNSYKSIKSEININIPPIVGVPTFFIK